MPEVVQAHPTRAQLLVIDLQERLMPHIDGAGAVIEQTVRMIRAARELRLPISLSEQNAKALGATVSPVFEAVGDAPRIAKVHFSLCGCKEAQARITSLMRPQVLLCGVEAHVCVQQTALDLLGDQMQPIVLADAVSSRRPLDREVALERMRSAGVVVTTVESVVFELLERCDTELFRRVLPLVK
jgi:nicotinamidase-related amidase